MKKINLKAIIFTFYTFVLAVLVTAYMGNKIYFLNFYILAILVGAYYFDLYGGLGIALISGLLGSLFANKAGFLITDTTIIVQIIIFIVIGIVSGLFQRQNNRLNNYLLHASLTDKLTNLYNFGFFNNRIKEEISRSNRYRRPVGLIMIDIDHFKNFNDTYGHEKGNEVLKMVSKVVKESIRQSDIAFRYGGEEFAVLLPETSTETRITANRLREQVEKQEIFIKGGEKIKITISIGYSYHPWPKKSKLNLIERADNALYKAKNTGRNKVCVFE